MSNEILFTNAAGTLTRGFFQNVSGTRRQGVEVGLRGKFENFGWYVNYSFIQATYQSTATLQNAIGPVSVQKGKRISAVPDQLSKVGFDYQALQDWFIGSDLFYVASQYLRGDDSNQVAKIPGYVVVNLNTRYRIIDQVEIFAWANNLFNSQYSSFGLVNRNAFSNPVGRVERFLSPGAPIAGWAGIRIILD